MRVEAVFVDERAVLVIISTLTMNTDAQMRWGVLLLWYKVFEVTLKNVQSLIKKLEELDRGLRMGGLSRYLGSS